MAKQSGLGDNLYFAGYDLSNDTQTVSIGMPSPLLDVTGIDKSAHERLYGTRDGSIDFSVFFNDAAGKAHPVLKTRPTTDIQVMYLRGTTLGNPAAAQVAKQVGYDPQRGADGSLVMSVKTLANLYPTEWGQTLTAGKRQDTTATAPATGVDFTDVTTAFGLAAYLQVFSFAGTSVTMTIQDSADNSAFANITGLNSFTAATGITTERIETDTLLRTIRRYMKVNTTGTFSECTFAVTVIRYRGANRET